MRELKRIVERYGMEWWYYVDDTGLHEREYVFTNPITGSTFTLSRHYKGLWNHAGYYWLLRKDGFNEGLHTSIRSGMQEAKRLMMTWSADGDPVWFDKSEGKVWYLARTGVPYVRVAQCDGTWQVRDFTTSRRRVKRKTLEEAKAVAMAWMLERELG